MIDMSYEEKELKDFSVPQNNTPKYPHGLKISLGKEELKKLNLSGTPEVGKKYKMEATVEVVEVSAENEGGDQKSYRVELQIKEMEFKKEETKESESDSTQIIYGD
jgi:hypothetical protein